MKKTSSLLLLLAAVCASTLMLSSCQGGPIGFFNKMGDRFERISSKKDKAVEAEPKEEESPATENDSKQNIRPEQTIVYGNAYDAFVNVRSEPSYNAKVIGKLHNGPEGAVLLGDYGEWMKIELDGRIGYVTSKYISYEPTVAYTGSVSGDWLVGKWDSMYTLFIYDNGTWERGYDYTFDYGIYIMQNNEVKFIMLSEINPEGEAEIYRNNDHFFTLKIDAARDILGDYSRGSFLSESEVDDLSEGMEYGMVTKKSFRHQKRALYKQVEKILKNR